MLLRNDAINCFNGIFIARMLNQTLGSKYTYGRMGNAKTIIREQVLLPIKESSSPDWQFMEDYIREREAIQVERCREFLTKRIPSIERERERLITIPVSLSHYRRRRGRRSAYRISLTASNVANA